MDELSTRELKQLLRSKKKSKKIKRKWRFSEKVIFGILLFSVGIFLSSIVYAFTRNDSTIWAYLLPSIGALASSAFAVFVWKEKNENLPKIKNNPNYDEEQLIEQVRHEVEQEFINLGR